MIKAVIFDFFGVLAVRASTSFRQTYFPNDPEKLAQIKKLQDNLGLGLIGYDDFILGLAKLAGVTTDIVLKYTEDYQPNSVLLYYIRDNLKPHYKVGIISNAGADWVLEILAPSGYKLFDDIIVSYKVGMIKPEPKIYQLSTENLSVDAKECIFIDDILAYCQGAEAVGMSTIWYRDFKQMKRELEDLLAASNN